MSAPERRRRRVKCQTNVDRFGIAGRGSYAARCSHLLHDPSVARRYESRPGCDRPTPSCGSSPHATPAVKHRKGEHDEPHAAEEQRNAHHDPEQADPLGHVGGVQRGAEGGLGHPQVARGVGHGLLCLGIDGRELLVVRAAARSQLGLRSVRPGLEAAHLRIDEAPGVLKRVDAHVLGEAARLGTGVDRLSRDAQPGMSTPLMPACWTAFPGRARGSCRVCR